jgi:hypothetical protein
VEIFLPIHYPSTTHPLTAIKQAKNNPMNKPEREHHGRPLGSPNKVTAEVRKAFATLIRKNLKTIEQDLATLKPKERLEVLISLARFVIPTIKAIEISGEHGGSAFPSFSFRLDALGEPCIHEEEPTIEE